MYRFRCICTHICTSGADPAIDFHEKNCFTDAHVDWYIIKLPARSHACQE